MSLHPWICWMLSQKFQGPPRCTFWKILILDSRIEWKCISAIWKVMNMAKIEKKLDICQMKPWIPNFQMILYDDNHYVFFQNLDREFPILFLLTRTFYDRSWHKATKRVLDTGKHWVPMRISMNLNYIKNDLCCSWYYWGSNIQK